MFCSCQCVRFSLKQVSVQHQWCTYHYTKNRGVTINKTVLLQLSHYRTILNLHILENINVNQCVNFLWGEQKKRNHIKLHHMMSTDFSVNTAATTSLLSAAVFLHCLEVMLIQLLMHGLVHSDIEYITLLALSFCWSDGLLSFRHR